MILPIKKLIIIIEFKASKYRINRVIYGVYIRFCYVRHLILIYLLFFHFNFNTCEDFYIQVDINGLKLDYFMGTKVSIIKLFINLIYLMYFIFYFLFISKFKIID